MLGGGDLFLVAAQDHGARPAARAEALGPAGEQGEEEEDAEKLSEEEGPRHPKAVEAAGHAGDESAEGYEERGRDARVQLTAREGDRGPRQGSDEVDSHSD